MTTEEVRPKYVAVWVWLVVLMIVGVLASYIPLARGAVIFFIFLLAAAKASLVALYYMHLRHEKLLIYAMALVPLVLLLGLTLLLFPDFVLHH